MAQHDYNIANQGFPAFRTDLNNALSAIQTTNSGTSRPSGAVAGQLWLDTTSATTPTLKYYDGADDISLATIDHSANTVNWLDSTVSVTGLTTTATGTVLTLSDSANTSTVNLIIDNDKEIRFREATANGTNYISLSAPASLSADVTYTLPVAPTANNQALISSTAGAMSFTPYSLPASDGTANQVLQTNGSGVVSFATPSGGGFSGSTTTTSAVDITLTSASTQVQYISMSAADKKVILPDATTLTAGGVIYQIYNNGTLAFTINDSAGNPIGIIGGKSTTAISVWLINKTTSTGIWALGSSNSLVPTLSTLITTASSISATSGTAQVAMVSSTAGIILYQDTSNNIKLVGFSLSGTTITYGTAVTATAMGAGYNMRSMYIGNNIVAMDSSTIAAAYSYTDGTNFRVRAIAATISGTTVTAGTAVTILDSTTHPEYTATSIVKLSAGKFGVAFTDVATGSGVPKYRAGTISGTTITLGSTITINNTSGSNQYHTTYSHNVIDTDKAIVHFNAPTPSLHIISVSGTTCTQGTAFTSGVPSAITGLITFNAGTTVYFWNGYTAYTVSVSGTTISSLTALGNAGGGNQNPITLGSYYASTNNSNSVYLIDYSANGVFNYGTNLASTVGTITAISAVDSTKLVCVLTTTATGNYIAIGLVKVLI